MADAELAEHGRSSLGVALSGAASGTGYEEVGRYEGSVVGRDSGDAHGCESIFVYRYGRCPGRDRYATVLLE